MKIAGSYTIDAPRDQVWAALNDIEVLARVVPGCERLEQTGENEFVGTVKIGIQSIRGTYSGRIRLEDMQPPSHYRLVASGRSPSGVVDGTGTVDLEEQDGKTVLTYAGDATIGGTLASVGQRLIEGAAKQLINQSLKALDRQIMARAQGAATEDGGDGRDAGASNAIASAGEATATETPSVPSQVVAAASEPDAVHTPSSAVDPAPPPPEPAASASQPAQPPSPTFERRSVVVPESEQLKPESVMSGVIADLIAERPWLPWVVVAFLVGVLFGRGRRD